MRNHNEELQLLEEAAELCQRVYGQQSQVFTRLVTERLIKGALRYGEGSFLKRDNLAEAIEEPPDACAYALLELQRVGPSLSEVDRQELRQYTLGVTAAAINLDAAIRRLQHARDELLS